MAVAAAVLLTGCTTAVVSGHPGRAGAPFSGTSASTSSGSSSRSDQASFADPALVEQMTADARADLAAANSYSYRTLAADLRNGLAHTTGAFRGQYRTTFTTVVEPAARKLGAG